VLPDPDGPGMSPDALDWHAIAEARRIQLERVQGRRLYVTAARVLDRIRHIVGVVVPPIERTRSLVGLVVRSARALPARLTAPRRERSLRAALAALPGSEIAPDAPTAADVTAVIVTAAQPERLARLLAALERAGIASIVVDNAGIERVATVVRARPTARRIRLAAPRSYAEANTVGLAEVTTPWALLLNDDVEPMHDDWFDRLRAAVLPGDGRPAASAVGAVLVHGRRGLLGGAAVDLHAQHAGIAVELDGPLARPLHLGRGQNPRPVAGALDVLAVTGACLLARTDTIAQVGGFHTGFDYGLEDVDLCLRLGRIGPVRVATDAVLMHEEGATRLRSDRRERTRRQAANRRLFDALHGPSLRARALAALEGHGDEVARPLRPALIEVHGAVPVTDVIGALEGFALRARRDDGPAPSLHLVGSGAKAPVDAGVPVLGWAASAAEAAAWSDELLDTCDVLVTADGDPDGQLAGRVPTLPVVRLASDASADEVAAVLHDVLRRPRWSLRIGAPAGARGARWGDTPVAAALRRELRAQGTIARVAHRPAWGAAMDRAADVVVTLKGRGVVPPAAPGQRTIVWIISHPSELAPGELDDADLVLAGSAPLAEHLRPLTSTPVHVLPQAADARTFGPGPRDPERASRVLFLGNSRAVPRPAVMTAVRAGLPLTLIGAGWHRFVDAQHVARDAVPYAELPQWYRSAELVLNDHWDEMRRWGLVSNRVLEVLACGGLVVSDALDGLDALTDGAVPTYTGPDELVAIVTDLLDDAERRAELAARGQAAVLAAHTWQHRAATLVALVDALPVVPVRGTAGDA
jgi:GT2 family glycosyltransferase